MAGPERFELPTAGFEDQNSSTELRTVVINNLMRSHLRLNIDVSNAIRNDWHFPKLDHWVNSRHDPNEIFNQTWLSMMTSLGLPPAPCLIFYTPPGVQSSFSHTDRDPSNQHACVAGFNFVVGEDPLDMVWFNPTILQHRRKIITDTGSPYETFPVDFNYEIDRCRIGNTLTLVRTDIPHWVGASIPSTVGRWSVSYRTTRMWPAWEDYFKRGVLSGSRTPALSFGD